MIAPQHAAMQLTEFAPSRSRKKLRMMVGSGHFFDGIAHVNDIEAAALLEDLLGVRWAAALGMRPRRLLAAVAAAALEARARVALGE